jgi:hypothetical protein
MSPAGPAPTTRTSTSEWRTNGTGIAKAIGGNIEEVLDTVHNLQESILKDGTSLLR